MVSQVNPIRAYDGPERRDVPHHRAILISFWAIILICFVVSIGSLAVAQQVKHNNVRAEQAICAIKTYADGVVDKFKDQPRADVSDLHALAVKMGSLVDCPPPVPIKVKK
jgi:hypothetical protein